jgi:HECT-domain (ubiquitin-transferase)
VLQFITGSPHLPAYGFGDNGIPVTFENESFVPSARTCDSLWSLTIPTTCRQHDLDIKWALALGNMHSGFHLA